MHMTSHVRLTLILKRNLCLHGYQLRSKMQHSFFSKKKNKFNIQNYLESDKMYHLWGFLNTIFNTSEHIVALGKEKSSAANSSETNNKRKISAVDPVENKKMGLETDTVYIGDDDVEFGLFGNRKGKRPNQGIQRWISLPIVMRDMIMKLIGENPSLVNKLHILGYSIIGTI
ncbi:hypothetical protein BDA99DRAFT_304319 [Phascolomyces articulosus]|uniref:Uncharacterized protein n=1 Tax=Phascolomyces articulosus TaxID=60185 RepID=A0AAD5K6N6_9FUNG|nr:hypothetical protein BDA99DRAFT_304319 [Phascolomyces articulosus]